MKLLFIYLYNACLYVRRHLYASHAIKEEADKSLMVMLEDYARVLEEDIHEVRRQFYEDFHNGRMDNLYRIMETACEFMVSSGAAQAYLDKYPFVTLSDHDLLISRQEFKATSASDMLEAT